MYFNSLEDSKANIATVLMKYLMAEAGMYIVYKLCESVLMNGFYEWTVEMLINNTNMVCSVIGHRYI